MTVVTEEKHVPAQSYTITKFIASDGKEFRDESSCIEYEKYLEMIKHPVIVNCIKDVTTFWEEHHAILYYLSSKADFDFLLNEWYQIRSIDNDFDKYGPGLYIFYSESGGDQPDSYYLSNLTHYMNRISDSLAKWQDSIRSKIGYEEE